MERILARKQLFAGICGACAVGACALFSTAAALSALTAACAVAGVDWFYARAAARLLRKPDAGAAVRLRLMRAAGMLVAFALGIQLLAAIGEPVGFALLAGLALPLLGGEAYVAVAARRN